MGVIDRRGRLKGRPLFVCAWLRCGGYSTGATGSSVMKRLSARQASIKDPIITEAATPEDIAVRRSRAGLQNGEIKIT